MRQWIHSIQEWPKSGVLSILGPTGAGKSSQLLDFLRKEKSPRDYLLVSVDAVAVYKGLDIGSAKAMGADRQDFEWLGLDIFTPSEETNVASYLERIGERLKNASKENRPIILIGGSHFYEKALVQGQAPGEASDPEFLLELKNLSNEDIKKKLLEKDSRWEKIHLNDRYRLERYSDLVLRQELSFDELKPTQTLRLSALATKIYSLPIGLDLERQDLEPKLKDRIEKMISAGWEQEIHQIIKKGFSPKCPGLQSMGYWQMMEFISGKATLDETREKILLDHLHLAKKQKTWIRGLMS